MATAFVLAGDCGGGVGFVSWNAAGQKAAGSQGGFIGYVAPAGAPAYRLAPSLGRSSFVLERYQAEPGGGSWVPVRCSALTFSQDRCPTSEELRMPDAWSVSCEHPAAQDGICVVDPD